MTPCFYQHEQKKALITKQPCKVGHCIDGKQIQLKTQRYCTQLPEQYQECRQRFLTVTLPAYKATLTTTATTETPLLQESC